MEIRGTTALVTGANRGLGEALVTVLIERGAAHVHATARDAAALGPLVERHRGRVSAHALDVTKEASVRDVAKGIPELGLLVNNAGVLTSFSLLEATPAQIAADLEVNVFGLLAATRAALPALERAAARAPSDRVAAAVVNVLSIASLAGYPALGGYSASKTAAHSMTQSLRAQLAQKRIGVHGVYAGPIDTDMVRSFDMPKTSARDVAAAIADGIEAGEEDIAPDPMARDVVALWRRDPKAVERRFAG